MLRCTIIQAKCCALQHLPNHRVFLAFWIIPGAAEEKGPTSSTDRNVRLARPACDVVDRADRAGNARFSTQVNGANHLSRIGGTRTGGGSGALEHDRLKRIRK